MAKRNFVSCCNQNILCGEVWFLQDIKGFTARKMFIGQCPICKNKVAILFEKRCDDNKEFIDKVKGIEAVKTIFREQKRKVVVFPEIKLNSLSGWIYGVNTQIKNKKGEVTQIRQYASDFNGCKTIVKKYKV